MRRLFSLFLVIALLAGCSKSEPDNPIPEKPKQESVTLSSGTNAAPVIATAGGSTNVSFTASSSWSASIINTKADSWCSVSPTSGGAGAATITITVKENTTPDNRSASVVIKAGTATQTIKVEQKQQDALTVTASSFEVPAEGGEIKVTAKSNVSFTHTISTDAQKWIKAVETKALKDSTLIFEIDVNRELEKRSGQIYLTSGDLKDTVNVYQAGETPTIVVGQNEYVLKSEGGSFEIEVASNVNAAMNMVFPQGVESWIEENTSKSISTNKFYFTAKANEGYDSRSAIIIFSNAENNLADTVTVTQAQKDAIVVAKSIYNVENSGGTIEIEIGHNVDYEYTISADWITKAETKAYETDKLVFNIAENTSYDNREGTITFTAGSLKQEVKVYQSEKGALIISKKDHIISDTGGEITLEIQANVEFSVSEPSVDWLHKVSTKGLQTHTLKYTVDPNESYDSRSTQLYVKNLKNGTQDTLTVTQAQKDAIVLAKNEYDFGAEGGQLDFEILTNVDVTVTIPDSCSSWIRQVKTRGLETKKLFFDISACDSLAIDRKGTITLTGGSAAQSIDVKQSGLSGILKKERDALIAFYDALGRDSWHSIWGHTEKMNEKWKSDEPVGLWYGVSVNENGRVKSIGLPGCYLTGSIPPEIGDLAELELLHLNNNNIVGEIPKEICNLKNLKELVLTTNYISGKIPEEIGNMEKLEQLWLHYNFLDGAIPESLINLRNLRDLRLCENKLSGPLPEAFYNWDLWKSWWGLNIMGNKFSFDDIKLPGPSGTVTCLDGRTLKFDEEYARNRYTILFQWSMYWETAFILPQIKSIYNDYKDKGVDIIGWTIDGSKEDALAFVRDSCLLWRNFFYDRDSNGDGVFDNTENCFATDIGYPSNYLTTLTVVDSIGRIVFSDIFDLDNTYSKEGYFKSLLENDFKYDKEESSLYESSDYTVDKQVKVIQKASVGKGINIVFMGDAFSDRLIADGTYDRIMKEGAEAIFTEEPYKTFREYFNIYYVNVVSKNECISDDSETALGCAFGSGSYVYGNDRVVLDYTLKAIAVEEVDDVMICVVLNSDRNAGTCFMYQPETNNNSSGGMSISYIPYTKEDEGYMASTAFKNVILHESAGHGFAKLADEYAYEEMGAVDSEYADQIKANQINWGWWKNVDFTNDPAQVRWKKFLEDTRYSNERLGIFEGGLTYWTGVWRPTENSIMRYNTGGFNVPSREAIYYRIHKLAYGADWEYDYEKFVEWDAINRKTEAQTKSMPLVLDPQKKFVPLHPPVVVPHSWREAK